MRARGDRRPALSLPFTSLAFLVRCEQSRLRFKPRTSSQNASLQSTRFLFLAESQFTQPFLRRRNRTQVARSTSRLRPSLGPFRACSGCTRLRRSQICTLFLSRSTPVASSRAFPELPNPAATPPSSRMPSPNAPTSALSTSPPQNPFLAPLQTPLPSSFPSFSSVLPPSLRCRPSAACKTRPFAPTSLLRLPSPLRLRSTIPSASMARALSPLSTTRSRTPRRSLGGRSSMLGRGRTVL